MRLIDADELLKDKVSNTCISRFEIENAPTVDAEPVIHGHWENRYKSKYFLLQKNIVKKLHLCQRIS